MWRADEEQRSGSQELILAAIEQPHGTTIVVLEKALNEARRLGTVAVPLAPSLLLGAAAAATSIDGAVLVDPGGRCHAAGVILDGSACRGAEDRHYGARHNSAIRYVNSVGGAVVAIVVSEDGPVKVIRRQRTAM